MKRRDLTIAYTPDSDDAFYYDALENDLVDFPGYRLRFRRAPMSELNREALAETYDVTAISSVVYPKVADRYAILSVGTSVGRGYGPVLVSRDRLATSDLGGRLVGVPGLQTTGCFLLRWLCPDACCVEMPFDEIGPAVVDGDLAAGVMIHEELLYYPQMGLRKVVDLGAAWSEQNGLPLPVGLNIARRDLGAPALESICAVIRRSLEYGLSHAEAALDRVSRFGRGREGRCTEQFVAMFANADSLRMPEDVRTALRVLLSQAADLGLADVAPVLDVVEGEVHGAEVRPARVA
jgi:1,4-dihydroxy-6-naphthoate synthase